MSLAYYKYNNLLPTVLCTNYLFYLETSDDAFNQTASYVRLQFTRIICLLLVHAQLTVYTSRATTGNTVTVSQLCRNMWQTDYRQSVVSPYKTVCIVGWGFCDRLTKLYGNVQRDRKLTSWYMAQSPVRCRSKTSIPSIFQGLSTLDRNFW